MCWHLLVHLSIFPGRLYLIAQFLQLVKTCIAPTHQRPSRSCRFSCSAFTSSQASRISARNALISRMRLLPSWDSHLLGAIEANVAGWGAEAGCAAPGAIVGVVRVKAVPPETVVGGDGNGKTGSGRRCGGSTRGRGSGGNFDRANAGLVPLHLCTVLVVSWPLLLAFRAVPCRLYGNSTDRHFPCERLLNRDHLLLAPSCADIYYPSHCTLRPSHCKYKTCPRAFT